MRPFLPVPSKVGADEGSADASGTTGPLKAVKFRVEFSNTNAHASSAAGTFSPDSRSQYPTCLTLVMEKGAHSTFKLAYNRLRAAWECVLSVFPWSLDAADDVCRRRFDTPRFGNAGLGVRLIPSPMPSPSLSPRSPVFI